MLNSENRYLFKFAWKSIRRNIGRSFFIGFSVSLAVVIAVWVVAFFDGLNSQIEEAVVKNNVGFFQLQDPLFARTTDSSHPHVYTQAIEKKLETYKAASPELVLDGNISTPDGAAGLVVIGIEPERHKALLPLPANMQEGEFISPTDENSVAIGAELARIFHFHLGEQLVLNYQDMKGELRSEILTIKGIFHYNSKSFEKKYVYINQSTWQKLFFNEDRKTTLFNRVTILTNGLGARRELEADFGKEDVRIKSWKDLNPEMAVILEFHDGMIRFFFIIIGVTVLMTVLTPVQMLWQERFKELKMMSILGVSVKKFWKIGIFEVIQMIVFSAGFSIVILLAIIGTQTKTGVDLRFLNDNVSIERAGIKLPGIIYPLLSLNQLLITFGFVIFILSVSYLWSIYRTLNKFKVEL